MSANYAKTMAEVSRGDACPLHPIIGRMPPSVNQQDAVMALGKKRPTLSIDQTVTPMPRKACS